MLPQQEVDRLDAEDASEVRRRRHLGMHPLAADLPVLLSRPP